MKNYTIHCNEEQLRLLRSAVELQMRVRLGQGFALTENLLDFVDPIYMDKKTFLQPLLDIILRKMVEDSPGVLTEHVQETGREERDMWVSLEKALGMRDGDISLGEWGMMKIEEDDPSSVRFADTFPGGEGKGEKGEWMEEKKADIITTTITLPNRILDMDQMRAVITRELAVRFGSAVVEHGDFRLISVTSALNGIDLDYNYEIQLVRYP